MGSPRFRRQVETFLSANALRLESVEDYFCILREDGSIAAGAGLSGDLIKCVAVDSAERSRGLLAPLLSHVIAYASGKGIPNLKVFTKPENEAVFTSLGFHTIARAPQAILLENGHGLEGYLASFDVAKIAVSKIAGQPIEPGRVHSRDASLAAAEYGLSSTAVPAGVTCHPECGEGSVGVIIMNANPFTLGHKYLVEKASGQVDKLFVIPVKEDLSLFPYSERLEMIRSGCEGLATVLDGSDYQISAATFPTYFLKDLSEASETQMLLDLDLFGRRIAPALGATVRFVGSEPTDPLTARYNELMKEVLPTFGISVVEIPRLEFSEVAVGLRPHSAAAEREWTRPGSGGNLAVPKKATAVAIRASDVREALKEGNFRTAAALTPPSTWPYLVAELMARALRMELDTPLKPGLVDRDSNGAHSDMDYTLMSGSIEVIRRSFIRHLPMLLRQRSSGVKEWKLVVEFGKAIEADVMEYTGGVNTYRGAIFALGLAALAHFSVICNLFNINHSQDSLPIESRGRLVDKHLEDRQLEITAAISCLAEAITPTEDSHGGKAVSEHGVTGALRMAQEGYKPLFEDWLPFYRCSESAAGAAGLRPYSAAASEAKREWTRPGPDSTAALRLRSGTTAAEPLQKTLLKIMSTLDDTCVIHRVGYERAQEVKNEAEALLDNFSEEGLREMKKRYDAEGISPGGAADMLALTILIDSLTN
ncbi:MAG: triphosphoribosyl-dephospho-CoA synthase [Bacteroidales bacterium]|nr:triphosphoribosyl-dephospho-CoA synthase [Bacteroidales bacterium]